MKMDGKDSEGRKVSLLNDREPVHHAVRSASFNSCFPFSSRSRTSSYVSSIGSSPTPQLIRSHSSDSTDMQTPSPITPDFGFDVEGRASPALSHQSGFFSQQKTMADPYQQLHSAPGPLPYDPAASAQIVYYAQPQQSTEPAPSATNPRPKKNSYPCPQAAKYKCSDHFTTSGHAARHAKKHTGKKDAYCPECNKAFTRKDNMEQHRRTHQGGRGATKGADRDVKKAKHRSERQRTTPAQSSTSTSASTPTMAPAPVVDPSLPVSPTGSFLAPMQSSDSYVDFQTRQYPDPTSYGMNGYAAGPPYGGLDALAAAASGEERSFEPSHQPTHQQNFDPSFSQNDDQQYDQEYEQHYDQNGHQHFESKFDPNFAS
jgi:hypothetical protein